MVERELIIDERISPIYGEFIHIPQRTLFWRGYDSSFPAVSDRPTYYTSKENANEFIYTEKDKLNSFMNTRPLRLIDIRYLKVILRQLLDDIKIKAEYEERNDERSQKEPTPDEIDIMYITASFGLCSLHHQIKILQQLFHENKDEMSSLKNLITYYDQQIFPIMEKHGFRIGETILDAHTMYFLQYFFSEFADGFISPRLLSPYHIEKNGTIMPEMILLNPEASGIIECKYPKQKIEKYNIQYLISKDKSHIELETGNFRPQIYNPEEEVSKKRGKYKQHPLNILEQKIIEKDPLILTLCHKGIQCAKRWEKNYVKLYQTEPPVPSTPISIFQNKSYSASPKNKL